MLTKTILAGIESRGVISATSPSVTLFDQLKINVENEIDYNYFCFYNIFNGYKSHDSKNHINLWGIDEIISKLDQSIIISGKKYSPFGDFMMDSDVLFTCFSDASLPVFLLYEERDLAPNFSVFIEKLVDGAFDIPMP